MVDPKRVLASIAGDATAPASARVAAAKALLEQRDKQHSNGKALGKKALAQRAASRVGGRGSPWGDDLRWSPGAKSDVP